MRPGYKYMEQVHAVKLIREITAEELAELVGEQSEQVKSIMLQNNV